MKNNQNMLTHLDISNNCFTSDPSCVGSLAKLIEDENSKIEVLNIKNCNLDDKALDYLIVNSAISNLAKNVSDTHLLSDSQISSQNTIQNFSLKLLIISENKKINFEKTEEVKKLLEKFKNIKLTI